MNKSTSNKFFESNTIDRKLPTANPQSFNKRQIILNNTSHTSSNHKRGYSSSTSKLNPQKFIHRQTFTNKMYPKMFNIQFTKRKHDKNQQQQNRQQNNAQQQNYQIKSKNNFNQFKNTNFQKTQQLINTYQNSPKIKNQDKFIVPQHWEQLKHHVSIFQKKLEQQNNKKVIKYFKQVQKHLQDVIYSLVSKLIHQKQEKYKMNQEKQIKQNLLKRRSFSRTQLNRKYYQKNMSSSISLNQKQKQTQNNPLFNTYNSHNQFEVPFPPTLLHKNTKISSSLLSLSNTQVLSLYKTTQFENSKLTLLTQKLRQQIHQMNLQLAQQRKSHEELQKKFDEIQEKFLTSEYRIHKLKEQLQVAHVIKDQNMAEKMKYIFTFQ